MFMFYYSEGGKYYVGESMDVNKRISSHKKGKGAAWTKNNEVISVLHQLRKNKNLFGNSKKPLKDLNSRNRKCSWFYVYKSPYGLKMINI